MGKPYKIMRQEAFAEGYKHALLCHDIEVSESDMEHVLDELRSRDWL